MKINVNEIEGYADMTVEEKLAALESYDMKPDYTGYIKKEVFDKTASELAAKKKELKAKLSEDELKKQKEAEDRAELEAKYDQLLRESNISKYKAKFLGMGYEEKLAESTAEAMVDGDTDKVFANQKKHLEAVDKKIRADVLKDTPKPTGDGDNPSMTLDKFRALPAMEREEWARHNPEEYKSLYTANDTGGNQ